MSKKIDNLEVLERLGDKEFVQNIRKNTGTNFIPTEEELIPLPSKGIPYRTITKDEDILNGKIRIRELKGHDEKVLTTQRYLKDGSALKRLVSNCLISDISIDDLTVFDFNYILFALRGFSYGDEYKFTHKCTNSFCEKEFVIDLKISELVFNELEDDFKEPIILKLPKSKFTIECILPRQYHIDEVRNREARTKKSETDYDKTLIQKMLVTTLRMTNKDGMEIEEDSWEQVYNELSVMDLAYLREKTNYKTDLEGKEVTCPYCNTTQKAVIPMGAEFFRFQ